MLTVTDLRVAGLVDPLGIERVPQFSWTVDCAEPDARQEACRIRVWSTTSKATGTAEVWDSGRVETDRPFGHRYGGPTLAPRSHLCWTVTVWDNHGHAATSSPARFTTGILDESGWRGRWIGAPADGPERAVATLRTEFAARSAVVHAEAYVCGLGLFELRVNGATPDDSVLNPAPTQYDHTVAYVTFDITGLVREGPNAVVLELAHGFFDEPAGVWQWDEAAWRTEPLARIDIDITYDDGTVDRLQSDTDWRATKRGPIVADDVFYGERHDAGRTQPESEHAPFDDSAWPRAVERPAPAGRLRAQNRVATRRCDALTPSVRSTPSGSILVESPRNVSGWLRIEHLRESAGRPIRVHYGQTIEPDGSLKRWGGPGNLLADWYPQRPIQSDEYVAAGTGDEAFEPRFTCKGFRYAEITGLTHTPAAADITVCRVHPDVPAIGTFECSEPLFNRLRGMMLESVRNNFFGERCDPLLEKSGWLGDLNVTLDALMMEYDLRGTLPSFLDVMADGLERYGLVPIMVPTANWGILNWVVWNSVFVFGIDALERYTGLDLTDETYAAVRRYVNGHIDNLAERGWLSAEDELADWVSPSGGTDAHVPYSEDASEGSGIVASAFAYRVFEVAAGLADRRGEAGDGARFRAAQSAVRAAVNDAFLDPQTGVYDTGVWRSFGARTRYRQTSNLVPLAFGMVPAASVDAVVDRLVEDVIAKDYHLDVGCVGAKYLLPVLSDHGHEDVALRVARQTTYPSWGYMADQDVSTTLWEMWEATSRSFDHYFLGSYDEWFFTHLAGIRDIEDGYGRVRIAPGGLHELAWVRAGIDTPRGRLGVEWRREAGTLELDVEIPFGTQAAIELPGLRATAGSGRHRFTTPDPTGAPIDAATTPARESIS